MADRIDQTPEYMTTAAMILGAGGQKLDDGHGTTLNAVRSGERAGGDGVPVKPGQGPAGMATMVMQTADGTAARAWPPPLPHAATGGILPPPLRATIASVEPAPQSAVVRGVYVKIEGINLSDLSMSTRARFCRELRALFSLINGVDEDEVTVELAQGSLIATVGLRMPPERPIAMPATEALGRIARRIDPLARASDPVHMSALLPASHGQSAAAEPDAEAENTEGGRARLTRISFFPDPEIHENVEYRYFRNHHG